MPDSNKSTSTLGQRIEAVGDAVSEKLNVPDILKHVEGFSTDRLHGLRDILPDAIKKLEDHATLENYDKLVAEIRDLGSNASKLKGKVVDAMWKKLQEKNKGIIGSLMGMFDGTGKWILRKLIDMGILGNDMVMRFKDQAADFLSEAKGKLAGIATAAGAGAALGKLKDGLTKPIEVVEGIKESAEQKFESSKKAVLDTLDQWQRFAARLRLTGTVKTIASCSKKVGELAYEKLSQGARTALESFKASGDPATDIQEFFVMLKEELGEIPEDVAEVVHEAKLSRMQEPKEKAKAMAQRSLVTLRKALLQKKKEGKPEMTEEKLKREFDPLSQAILAIHYDDKRSDTSWEALGTYVNALGTTVRIDEKNGLYHAEDYGADHWTDMPLGFTSQVSTERILGMPALYFNSTGVIESFSANTEEVDRFFTSFSDALGGQAPKSKAALEKLRAKWRNGEIGMKDILFRTDDTMAELADAVEKEVELGKLAFAGLQGGAVAIGGAGWYVFKTSWGTVGNTVWDGLIKTFAHNTDHGMGEALRSGMKAAGAEYTAGSSRLVAYVGGWKLYQHLKEADDPFSIGVLIGASVATGVTALGLPLYVVGKTLSKGHSLIEWVEDTREAFQKKQFESYYARRTQRLFARRYLGSEKVRSLFAGEANLSHMVRIDKELRQIVTIEHVTDVSSLGNEARRVKNYDRATKGKVAKAEKNMEHWVEKYLVQNYESDWINRYITRRVDSVLLERVQRELQEEVAEIYATTGRFPAFEELQIILDRTILKRIPGVRKVWDASRQITVLEETIKGEEELVRKGKDPAKLAELRAMRAEAVQYHGNFPRLEKLNQLQEALDNELKAVTSANAAAQKAKVQGALDNFGKLHNEIVDEAVKEMQRVKNAPQLLGPGGAAQFNRALETAIEHEGYVMEQFLSNRMEMIKKLRDTPGMHDLAKKLAEDTDELVDIFRKAKADAFVKLGKEYSRVYKAADAAEKKVLKSNFQRFFKGATGGGKVLGYVTRPMRMAAGRLKFGSMLAGATLLYKYYTAPQSTDEQNKFEVFEFIEKEGPEVIDLMLAVAAPFGSYDWYRLYEGKDFHGNALTTGDYVTHTLFGVAGTACDIAAFFSFGATAAAVRGVRIGGKVVTKGTRMAKLSVRALELAKKIGGIEKMKDILASYKQYKAMGKTSLAAGQALHGISHAGYVPGTLNVAGQLIAGTLRKPDEPVYGIAANEQDTDYGSFGQEAKEAIDEALGPEPTKEAKIESQGMQKAA